MTIQIEDSGTGDIIGPAFVGVLRVETGAIVVKQIPLELFKRVNWDLEKPYIYAAEAVVKILIELKAKTTEKTILCQSHIFKYLREYFNNEGIKPENGIIEGLLHDTLEKEYISYLQQIGVDQSKLDAMDPASIRNKNDYHHNRNKLLREWVIEDVENRIKYVKTGFKKALKRIKEETEQKNNTLHLKHIE